VLAQRQQAAHSTSTETPTSGDSPGGSGPGFGVVAMLAALAAVALLARR
jgi:PGF-CTERM protein